MSQKNMSCLSVHKVAQKFFDSITLYYGVDVLCSMYLAFYVTV